jgi:hypothetical protein
LLSPALQSAEDSLLLSDLRFAEKLQLRATLPELAVSVTGRPAPTAVHLGSLYQQASGGARGSGSAVQQLAEKASPAAHRARLYGEGAQGLAVSYGTQACLEEEEPIVMARCGTWASGVEDEALEVKGICLVDRGSTRSKGLLKFMGWKHKQGCPMALFCLGRASFRD